MIGRTNGKVAQENERISKLALTYCPAGRCGRSGIALTLPRIRQVQHPRGRNGLVVIAVTAAAFVVVMAGVTGGNHHVAPGVRWAWPGTAVAAMTLVPPEGL